MNQKKAFFKRNTPVEKLSPELLKNMKGILQEGVIFASNKRKWIKKNIGFLFTWWKIHLERKIPLKKKFWQRLSIIVKNAFGTLNKE